jgi:AcrR family transcriptional regulator
VETAIDLIEERGVAALTMRDVASRLGAATSAVYRHVADKEALLLLAADRILGHITVPETGGWHERLIALERSIRATLRRYPGVSEYIFHTSPRTGHSMRHLAALLGIFRDAGLDEREADAAVFAIYRLIAGDSVIGRPAGVTQDEADAWFAATLDTLLRGFGLEIPGA